MTGAGLAWRGPVPAIAPLRTGYPQQSSPLSRSLDHLVGKGECQRREREAERRGSLEIDYQLELGGLFHWQIGRLSVRPTAVTRAWINSTDAR